MDYGVCIVCGARFYNGGVRVLWRCPRCQGETEASLYAYKTKQKKV